MAAKKNLKRWIDLHDPAGAKLKAGSFHGKLVLIVEGCPARSLAFHRAVSTLGFVPSKSGKYLARTLTASDARLSPSFFHDVWPKAALREMDVSEFRLNLEKIATDQAKRIARAQALAAGVIEENDSQDSLVREMQEIVDRANYLGRNMVGNRVFSDAGGRFYLTDDANQKIVRESSDDTPSFFLRAVTPSDARECAKGLLRACDAGEAYHYESLRRFASIVLDKDVELLEADDLELIGQTIDSAMLEVLAQNNDTAGKAWAEASYYQEMMPGRALLTPDSANTPYLPAPVAVQVQRFLADSESLRVNGKIPALGYGLLPDSTQVFVQDSFGLSFQESASRPAIRPAVHEASEQRDPVAAGYWRISGKLSDARASNFFDGLREGAICIVTTGEIADVASLGVYGTITQSIKIPEWLSGTERPIYLIAMQKIPDITGVSQTAPTAITSWDDLKTLVDETLIRLDKAQAANEFIGDGSSRIENRYQRPYLAFSKVGTSSTMVPKNLQSALGTALTRLQETHGSVDQYVSDEVGVGDQMLGELFSPEQVDAIGLAINRIQGGRGFILGDETGIGKGRVIAAAATWANKQGKRVIFITDRSNLFSDLARDLIDINEWERFRPIMTNTDGKILDIMGDAEELVPPMGAAQFKRLMQEDTNTLSANIIFTTYSQIHTEKSEKAEWLQSLCKDSLVICDESHIAAGSDSNIAKQVQSLVDESWGVLYSSATWAKSSKNLHIYARALPDSVNISQVVTAMKEEGESFGEVFSSMLAADGAFIRREHDLSKIDFIIEIDTEHTSRNEQVVGQVSEILSMMAVVSGDISNMLQKMNSDTHNALMEAQSARKEIQNLTEANKHDQTENLRNKKADLLQMHESLRTFLNNINDPRGQFDTFISLVDQPGFIEEVIAARGAYEGFGEEAIQEQLQKWHDTREAIQQAEAILKAVEQGHADARMTSKLFASSFGTGGAIYQAMRRTLAALSVDHAAQKAIESAKSGRRPVIVFEETGEAFVQKFIREEYTRIQDEVANYRKAQSEGGVPDANHQALQELADMLDADAKPNEIVRDVRVPNLQDMMRELASHLGGIRIMESAADADVQMVANARLDEIPGVSAETIEQYQKGMQEIAEKINTLPALPVVPVDALRVKFQEAGLSLGEISGRQYALEPVEHDGEWKSTTRAKIIKRSRKKSDVTQMVKAFNAGRIDGLAINKSAATGLSIHASPRFADSRQRELFEMQSDENPTNRIQLFGRVNRFDQVIAPRIVMMTTGLKGEQRTIMMQNKKLKNLSANIRSSRENAALIENVPDLLNATGDRICQEYLLENPGVASRLDIPMQRINIPYGISHLLTQRIALLSPQNQEKVYDDLRLAHNEAQVENNLTMNADDIVVRDWQAKTVDEHIAWGPSKNLDVLSVFDGPVYQRDVEFTQNYQPYRWKDVGRQVAQSSQRLFEDERVEPMRILSVQANAHGEWLPDFAVNAEQNLSEQERLDRWVKGLIESMVLYLPSEAVRVDNIDVEILEDRDDGVDGGSLFKQVSKHVPLNFESLAGHWVAAHSRIPGSRISQRLMALVSKSGQTAKLWFLNEQGAAEQYLMDLTKVLKHYESAQPSVPFGALIKKIETVDGITSDSWQRKRFDRVWGSIDPEVRLLDFSGVTESAVNTLQGKKIIALRGTGLDSIEAAMSSAEHNAVKEAEFRRNFFERVMHKLTPGTQIYIAVHDENKKFTSLINKHMVITDVRIPPQGHESTLSRWKFTLISPGEESPVVISGALLFKLGGLSPNFQRLNISGNLYMGMGNEIQRVAKQFDRFESGPILRRKTLLVGNMFQAGEWARESKRGMPIIYTDSAGQRHRAVEVNSSGLFKEQIKFPLRLYDRQSIVNFVEKLYASEQHQNTHTNAHTLFTSFKGMLIAQSNHNQTPPDMMVFETNVNAIGWMVNKGEKERIRRVLRNAVSLDQKEWNKTHPDEPYPVSFSTKSKRSNSASEKQTMLSIALPETMQGRLRFMDIFVKSLGLQLFVPESTANRAAMLAREVEQERYARLAQPALEDRKRAYAAREKRENMRKMLAGAFREATGGQAMPVQADTPDRAQEPSSKEAYAEAPDDALPLTEMRDKPRPSEDVKQPAADPQVQQRRDEDGDDDQDYGDRLMVAGAKF